MIYAVIDTNVLVSALLTQNPQSATVRVVDAIFAKKIVPLFDEEILEEYEDVLHRQKFGFSDSEIDLYLGAIRDGGVNVIRVMSDEIFPDPKDVVFYEVDLALDGAFLITGNKKHYPNTPIVVTPAEMVEILSVNGLL